MDCAINNMKKLSFAFFSFLFFLTACGKSDSIAAEIYTCEEIIKDGVIFEASDFFSTPPVLTLYQNNNAKLAINGKECEGTWNCENDVLSLSMDSFQSGGTLEEGICRIDFFEQGITYCFYSENFSSAESEKENESSPNANFWNGDWYGYWHIENASGQSENLDGIYFDCFAKIDVKTAESGEIILWDENSSFSEPVSAVELSFDFTSSDSCGIARSLSGFLLNEKIAENSWIIDSDNEEFENTISFSAHYSGDNGEFDYFIFLRPWGYTWDDAVNERNIRLPYYYDSWYIPMINDKKQMPDKLECEKR